MSLSHNKTASRPLSAGLDGYWLSLRLPRADVPTADFAIVPREQPGSPFPTIEEVLALYLSVKGQSKRKLLQPNFLRVVGYSAC